ncbi:MAG: tetratricopeptide repeat protein [Alkalispirochaetaceae bacterium]
MAPMSSSLTVVIALLAIVIVILLGILITFLLAGRKKKAKKLSTKDRKEVLKEANRQLSQNPKDHRALQTLADLYYDEQEWEKATKTYAILMNLCATNPDITEWEVTMRHGLAALKMKQYEEAYKSLQIARTMNDEPFEINHNLGFLEYKRKNYERAVQLLNRARGQQPEHVPTLRYLGHALYQLKKYKESIKLMRGVVDQEPEDKESLFVLAKAYYEIGQNEQAVMVFTHLRPDPKLGPNAALYAGTIHMKQRDFQKAQLDFELGLRHQSMREEVKLELKYRLAEAYIKEQQVGKALEQLHEIMQINPQYKDVQAQASRHRELQSNKNLQIYLMSPTSEFIALCRRIVQSFHKNSTVKIIDINVNKNEYTDILAEVETVKWQDTMLFRFIRTTGQVGELMLRDMHGRIKELHAGQGYCFAAGTFTEGAVAFVEARLIDLINKDELTKVLKRTS